MSRGCRSPWHRAEGSRGVLSPSDLHWAAPTRGLGARWGCLQGTISPLPIRGPLSGRSCAGRALPSLALDLPGVSSLGPTARAHVPHEASPVPSLSAGVARARARAPVCGADGGARHPRCRFMALRNSFHLCASSIGPAPSPHPPSLPALGRCLPLCLCSARRHAAPFGRPRAEGPGPWQRGGSVLSVQTGQCCGVAEPHGPTASWWGWEVGEGAFAGPRCWVSALPWGGCTWPRGSGARLGAGGEDASPTALAGCSLLCCTRQERLWPGGGRDLQLH